MNQAFKTLVLFSALLITLVHSTTLKSPKVYNALITTDQNLIPSRAYPVVQPTIHDAGFGYSAFGLGHHHQNAFGLYDPYAGPYHHHHGGFVGGPVPGYQARNQFSFFSHQAKHAAGVSAAAAAAEESSASAVTNDQAIISGNDAQLDAGSVANANVLKENPPIPLNEYGLPPNLIPLSTPQDFNRQGNPVNLQPYPYNSYPLIYDSFGGYNVNPYLPPFSYYPSPFGPGAAGAVPGAAAGALPGVASGAAPGAGPNDAPLDGDGGYAGAVGGDDGVAGGAGGDLDASQGGDVDGGAGGDDGGTAGASGGSGGDSDGGVASEKQTNDGGSGGSSSSSSSGGSGGGSGSSSSSGGSGGSGASSGGSSGSSSSSGYRGSTRRTGFRGSNIRSALRADSEIPTQ